MDRVDDLKRRRRRHHHHADRHLAVAARQHPSVAGDRRTRPVAEIDQQLDLVAVVEGRGAADLMCEGVRPGRTAGGAECPTEPAVGAIGDDRVVGPCLELRAVRCGDVGAAGESALDDRVGRFVPVEHRGTLSRGGRQQITVERRPLGDGCVGRESRMAGPGGRDRASRVCEPYPPNPVVGVDVEQVEFVQRCDGAWVEQSAERPRVRCVLSLHHDHPIAALGQEGRRRRAGGSAADDQHVSRCGGVSGHRAQPLTIRSFSRG